MHRFFVASRCAAPSMISIWLVWGAPQAYTYGTRPLLCDSTHSCSRVAVARNRATEQATPYRTCWLPCPPPSIPDGGGLGGRSTRDSLIGQRSHRTCQAERLNKMSAKKPLRECRPTIELTSVIVLTMVNQEAMPAREAQEF